MKKSSLILLLSLLLLGTAAHAQQFKKPLPSRNKANNLARYNVGVTGGLTSTYWVHFGGTGTKYHEPFNFGPIGGLVVERMFNKDLSLSVEGLFAMRNVHMDYNVLNFPVAINVNKDFYRQYDADYMEIDVQVPLTYYFGEGKIRPYAYVAPRFSLPLSGNIKWQKMEILEYGTENEHYNESTATLDTLKMTAQNMRPANIGLVLGVGVRFKVKVSTYYYILMNLDASAHSTLINSFTKDENNGDSEIVIGASYIDPYLLQKRFNTDAAVKFTLLFPIKKPLKDACMDWGEYD